MFSILHNFRYTCLGLCLCLLVSGCRVEFVNDDLYLGYSERCPRYLQEELLRLLNQQRETGRQCGDSTYPATTPLTWHATVAKVASEHVLDMAQYDFLSETASNGTSFSIRLSNSDYPANQLKAFIGSGYESTATALDAWLAYPQLCAALMSPVYIHLGGACAERADSAAATYWNLLLTQP